MQSRTDIGFGKKIRLAWLDSALEHAASGKSFEQVREELAKEIAVENPGPEAIRKIQAALKRVWFTPPDYCQSLHDAAIRLFRQNHSQNSRFLLNWGMATAAYPFVGTVAEALGRLLKLQKEARRTDVERRIHEQHGDRDFVSRITRYDVSSFLDWGVIAEAQTNGVYLLGRQVRPGNVEQQAWLVEAVLISRGKTQMALSELRHHPVLFPVVMESLHSSTLRSNPRLKVVRQNLSEECVVLSQPNGAD